VQRQVGNVTFHTASIGFRAYLKQYGEEAIGGQLVPDLGNDWNALRHPDGAEDKEQGSTAGTQRRRPLEAKTRQIKRPDMPLSDGLSYLGRGDLAQTDVTRDSGVHPVDYLADNQFDDEEDKEAKDDIFLDDDDYDDPDHWQVWGGDRQWGGLNRGRTMGG